MCTFTQRTDNVQRFRGGLVLKAHRRLYIAGPVELSAQTAGCGGAVGSGCHATLEETQGQIFSQSPTDATRFWWNLYGS